LKVYLLKLTLLKMFKKVDIYDRKYLESIFIKDPITKPFEHLSPNTITAHVSISSNINIELFFKYVNVPLVYIRPQKTKKIKIPHIEPIGSIFSMVYKKERRGNILCSAGNFRNGISMRMSIKDKNVHCRLFSNKFIISGCSKDEHVIEVSRRLLNIFHTLNSLNINIYDKIPYINNIKKVMVNYSYNIGYKIRRDKLNDIMKQTTEFFSSFDPLKDLSVRIKYKSKHQTSKKIRYVSILVHQTGSIMHSGHVYEEDKHIYELFNEYLNFYKDEIKQKLLI
jgi:hypothetical protein